MIQYEKCPAHHDINMIGDYICEICGGMGTIPAHSPLLDKFKFTSNDVYTNLRNYIGENFGIDFQDWDFNRSIQRQLSIEQIDQVFSFINTEYQVNLSSDDFDICHKSWATMVEECITPF